MNNNRILIVIGILIVCCISCMLYLKNNNYDTTMNSMTIRQTDLNRTERDLYTLFDTGTTDIFDFMVDMNEINQMVLSVEKLDKDKWVLVEDFYAQINVPHNRIMINVDYTKGGRFSIGGFDKDGMSSTTSGDFEFSESEIKIDEDKVKIIEPPYGVDTKIVKNKPIVLQLFYTGEELDNDLIKAYDDTSKFADYENVMVVTATFLYN